MLPAKYESKVAQPL